MQNYLLELHQNICSYDKFNETTIKKAISYCNVLEKNIIAGNINSLFDCIYLVNFLYKCTGLMKILNLHDEKELSKYERLLEKYIESFFSNKKIFKRIKNYINDKHNNLDKNKFINIEAIIQKFISSQNNDANVMSNNIKHIASKINGIINTDYLIKINGHDTILSRQSYYILQRNMTNAETRLLIEKTYFQKSEKCFDLLEKLIIERYKYAKILGYSSFFDLVKQKTLGDSENIKLLINSLLEKIEYRSRKEVERISRELKKDGHDKKVDTCDIIFYYEKLKSKYLFSPNDVLDVLFTVVFTYFGITFKKIKCDSKLWNNVCDTYEVLLQQKNLGIVHIDLFKYTQKKIINILHK